MLKKGPLNIGLSSCNSKNYSIYYGTASKYIASNSSNYNCYAHALGLKKWINVWLNRINCIGFTVSEIAKQVINDLRQLGRNGRIINSWDSKIKSNEYR